MKIIKLTVIVMFLLFFSKISFSAVSPEIYQKLKKDFTHLSGLIIGIEDGQIIIDKGLAQGVKPKDIFTVYKLVKKIVHPETKKTLGYLKKAIGKIEIVSVEENFAIGRVISQKESFPVPAIIKRFADIKILVISETAKPDESLYLLLKNNLPEAKITFDPNKKLKDLTPQFLLSQGYDMVFTLTDIGVEIFDYKLELARYYGTLTYKSYIKPLVKPRVKEIYKPSPKTYTITPPNIVGKTEETVLQAEFADVDNDNLPEMIYFNSQGLFIVKIKGEVLAHYTPKNGKIVNFSVGQSGWIALNIFDGRAGMRSEILRYTPQGLICVIKNINLILNFVDYMGQGIKDTLIGQTFDPDNFFGKEVYILKRENEDLIYAKELKVPSDYRNIGSIFVDLDEDGEPEILNYLSDGKLAIYKQTEKVWESPHPVAKHFYEIKLIKGKKGKEIVKQIVYPFISPISADINKDGKTEVVFVSIDFPLDKIKKDLKYLPLNSATSQLFVLGFDKTYFFKNLGNTQTGFITGLGIFDNGIYYVLVKGKYPGDTESELYLSLLE